VQDAATGVRQYWRCVSEGVMPPAVLSSSVLALTTRVLPRAGCQNSDPQTPLPAWLGRPRSPLALAQRGRASGTLTGPETLWRVFQAVRG